MGTTPGSGEVRFSGFDTLGQQHTWDDVTRATVLGRLSPGRGLRFFNAEQEKTARALLDRLLAQDDEPRVPVLEMIDERLYEHRGDGYRYDEMPEDWDAFGASIGGLDADARALTGRPFWDVSTETQMALVDAVRTNKGDWHGMPCSKVFALWTRYACDAFYSHPWAWNEIGFGGPAYPRGYKNLGTGRREPWEVPERDAADPVPWAQRAEKVRADHEATLAAGGAGTGEVG